MNVDNKRKPRINILIALGAALVAFFVSAIWYMAFSGILVMLSDAYVNSQNSPFLWIMLIEFGRSFAVTLFLYYLVIRCGISNWWGAVKLGLFLWIFPVAILLGSIVHENYSAGLAVIHAGDWLVKLLFIAVIVGWGHQKKLNNLKV